MLSKFSYQVYDLLDKFTLTHVYISTCSPNFIQTCLINFTIINSLFYLQLFHNYSQLHLYSHILNFNKLYTIENFNSSHLFTSCHITNLYTHSLWSFINYHRKLHIIYKLSFTYSWLTYQSFRVKISFISHTTTQNFIGFSQ